MQTPLIRAVKNQDSRRVSEMIASGANINPDTVRRHSGLIPRPSPSHAGGRPGYCHSTLCHMCIGKVGRVAQSQ